MKSFYSQLYSLYTNLIWTPARRVEEEGWWEAVRGDSMEADASHIFREMLFSHLNLESTFSYNMKQTLVLVDWMHRKSLHKQLKYADQFRKWSGQTIKIVN